MTDPDEPEPTPDPDAEAERLASHGLSPESRRQLADLRDYGRETRRRRLAEHGLGPLGEPPMPVQVGTVVEQQLRAMRRRAPLFKALLDCRQAGHPGHDLADCEPAHAHAEALAHDTGRDPRQP
jgi:hypothetical protein